MSIRVSIESARGCGFRSPGGLYLVAPALSEACPRLPHQLTVCPCCGAGIKPARGYTWVAPRAILPAQTHGSPDHNAGCPLGMSTAETGIGSPFVHRMGERAGLIWVGEAFYSTPAHFLNEAAEMGVSRRISAVPRDFVVGETYVFLGHRKAVPDGYEDAAGVHYDDLTAVFAAGLQARDLIRVMRPGIISVFRPHAIEYVLRPGEEDDAELLAGLERRGIDPVQVIRAGQESAGL